MTHRDILDIHDKKFKHEIMTNGSDQDQARILSLGTKGTSAAMTVPSFVVRYTNQEMTVALSQYLGAPIILNPKQCQKCNAMNNK